jgi:hypothetical protein
MTSAEAKGTELFASSLFFSFFIQLKIALTKETLEVLYEY